MSFIQTTLSAAVLAALCCAAPAQAADRTHARLNPRSCDKPVYPPASRAAKHEGTVRVEFLVEVDGSVKETRIASSSGHDALDLAARDSLKLCKFVPATLDGEKIKDWASVKYSWTL